jgi:metalloendopeptidase OMA1, mitochondrial
MKMLVSCGSALLLFLFTSCYTVPETGRQSVILISPDAEAEMGATAFADLRTKEKVSTDSAANARVRRVGQRIADVVGGDLPSAKWEFVVFDAPDTVNAFALPGGKVGVYTGLLDLAASDDELAIVMGHEIGHVTARHGAERMTTGMGIEAFGAVAGAVADKKFKNAEAFKMLYGGSHRRAVRGQSRLRPPRRDHLLAENGEGQKRRGNLQMAFDAPAGRATHLRPRTPHAGSAAAV